MRGAEIKEGIRAFAEKVTRALISAIFRFSAACRGSGSAAARASLIAPAESGNASAPSKVGLARPSIIWCQSARPWR